MKSPNPVPLSICLGGELHVCLCSLLYGEGRLLCLSSGGMMGCVCVCVCVRTCTGVLWPRHWDLAPWGNSCHHEARGSHQPDPEPVPPPQPRSHHFARMAPRTAWFQAPKRQAENLVKGYRSWQESALLWTRQEMNVPVILVFSWENIRSYSGYLLGRCQPPTLIHPGPWACRVLVPWPQLPKCLHMSSERTRRVKTGLPCLILTRRVPGPSPRSFLNLFLDPWNGDKQAVSELPSDIMKYHGLGGF